MSHSLHFLLDRPRWRSSVFPYTTLFRSLGTVNPVRDIIRLAKRRKIPVLLDGAQAVPHLSVDVQELDCDFYVFSGHKVYGPDRKSTRLNSSHRCISYAVFCLKKTIYMSH